MNEAPDNQSASPRLAHELIGADEMRRLKMVRDMFTHQYFPRH